MSPSCPPPCAGPHCTPIRVCLMRGRRENLHFLGLTSARFANSKIYSPTLKIWARSFSVFCLAALRSLLICSCSAREGNPPPEYSDVVFCSKILAAATPCRAAIFTTLTKPSFRFLERFATSSTSATYSSIFRLRDSES